MAYDAFLKLALQRFLALRERTLRKHPATGELLIWLNVLALAVGTYPERLDDRGVPAFDPVALSPMTFEKVDHGGFPALDR